MEQVGLRVPRIDSQRLVELPPGSRPIPVVELRDEPQRGVDLHERAVERSGAQGGRLCLGKNVVGRNVAPHRAVTVRVTQARPGQRIRGVLVYGALKVLLGLPEAGRVTLREEIATLKVEIVGLLARGGALHQRATRCARKPDAQRSHDRPCDLVLDGEHVSSIAIILVRPEMVAGRGVDELGAHPQLRSCPPDAALQYVADVELAPDLPDVDRLPLEAEGRGAGGHA